MPCEDNIEGRRGSMRCDAMRWGMSEATPTVVAMDPLANLTDPFEAMAEPVRRRLVEVLASGEHTAGELAGVASAEFRISRTATSKHLRVLRDAGFVEVVGDQQWRWYYLTHSGLDALQAAVDELRAKMSGGVGWDIERRQKRDPLGDAPSYGVPVPRKGRGRPPRRGHRGRQTVRYIASEPDLGLYPISSPPPEPSHAPPAPGGPPRING